MCESVHIIVMTKYPVLGKVKTRLIPAIGTQEAYDLHMRMSEHTVRRVRKYAESKKWCHVIVHVAGCPTTQAEEWLGAGSYQRQVEGGLGVKMQEAVKASFLESAKKVIVVGSDCPSISGEVIEDAINFLESSDVVYAPAFDGGYVLVGLSCQTYSIFDNVDWGTEHVLKQSLRQAKSADLKVNLLPPMSDVDVEADLKAAYKILEVSDDK